MLRAERGFERSPSSARRRSGLGSQGHSEMRAACNLGVAAVALAVLLDVVWANGTGTALLKVAGATIEYRDGLVTGEPGTDSTVVASVGIKTGIGDYPVAECFVDNVVIRVVP